MQISMFSFHRLISLACWPLKVIACVCVCMRVYASKILNRLNISILVPSIAGLFNNRTFGRVPLIVTLNGTRYTVAVDFARFQRGLDLSRVATVAQLMAQFQTISARTLNITLADLGIM